MADRAETREGGFVTEGDLALAANSFAGAAGTREGGFVTEDDLEVAAVLTAGASLVCT